MLETDDYLSLFLNHTPMIDTRSPGEFAKGSFPGAQNLPLMTNEERAKVGTCYKQQGQAAAIALGHELVHGQVKEQRVAAWLNFVKQHPQAHLFCWRGGLRSQICQQWMAEAGCSIPRVVGGYKAMRRFLIDSVEHFCASSTLLLVAGHTGSAKTELLRHIANSVDLEGLAHHRGSAFGKRVGGQPSQINFENALGVATVKQAKRFPALPTILEDESRLIGRCFLPLTLQAAMQRAKLLVVDSTLEERIEHSFNNYIISNLQDHQAKEGIEPGFERFADELRNALSGIRRRLGGQRHKALVGLLEDAIQQHRDGDSSGHRVWVEVLLRDYYQPMYNYQINQKKERILFRGPSHAVLEYLSDHDYSCPAHSTE